jgi:hypothetical protein
MILVGNNITLIGPEREFPLGVVRDDQRIVREIVASRLINARVIDADEVTQSGTNAT